MSSLNPAANPFVLMMNPELVLAAMEKSESLERLQRRQFRPLDRPLLPGRNNAAMAADAEVDAEPEIDIDIEDGPTTEGDAAAV